MVAGSAATAPTRSNGNGNGHGGHTNGNGNGHGHAAATKLRTGGDSPAVQSGQFARFQLDAPSCDNCGAITVRNGNCYLCHNCGNSMGCS